MHGILSTVTLDVRNELRSETDATPAAAQVRLIVWCLDCRHQIEPDGFTADAGTARQPSRGRA
jgi:hypothetical protein